MKNTNAGNGVIYKTPCAISAEVGVLGGMILDNKCIPYILETISDDCFYENRNKIIFNTIVGLYNKGLSVDTTTLTQALADKKALEYVGGVKYISDLMCGIPSIANLEDYCLLLKEKYFKRALIDYANNVLKHAYNEEEDAFECIEKAEANLYRISEKRYINNYVGMRNITKGIGDTITKLYYSDTKGVSGIPTGFVDLDMVLGGFQKSEFIVIAARPSMGKTALILSMLSKIAIKHNIPVGLLSLEMSATHITLRLISMLTFINNHNIRTGNINGQDYNKILSSLNILNNAPIFIDDCSSVSISELRTKCKRMKIEQGVQIIFVDYLQLIRGIKSESREREISSISATLKQIAKELDIPIVATAQLNRLVEQRADKRPHLADIRESGSIEQDADVVMFIYRPEYYNIPTYPDGSKTERSAEIIVAKQRNGALKDIRVKYVKEYTIFMDHLEYDVAFGDDEPLF